MTEEKRRFETEVSRLLSIVANSLYSRKEIFLRELVSNASDACDRLRYLTLTTPGLIPEDTTFDIRLSVDPETRTLEISDNGIGMDREALISDLGTIARSGTSAYIESLGDSGKADLNAIGQFGVGFYSAFMVAREVEVISRRAGDEAAWRWVSDGTGEYTISEGERAGVGTTVRLKLREGEDEFLETYRLRHIVKTYSDHIALPILLVGEDGKEEKLNQASALWMRPRSEITEDQYEEFFHHVGGMAKPWMTLHWKAEGTLEYANLLYIPEQKPFDLFDPARKHGVRLFVKRVFISEEAEGLVPAWLRFLRGVVDSEDLPLNISREMLQNNRMIGRMRKAIVNRVVNEITKKAADAPDEFAVFWKDFGAVIKEGLYEDFENRDALLKLARFHSTAGQELTSLADYVSRMKPGQDSIYYITGEETGQLRQSPQLEGFVARGVEVLLMTDPVDMFWLSSVPEYESKGFRSVTQAGTDLDEFDEVDGKPEGETEDQQPDERKIAALLDMFRVALKDEVKEVRSSGRLTDSVACLVSDDGDLDLHFERVLAQHNRIDQTSKRILEINPKHPLVTSLAGSIGRDGSAANVETAAWLLLDQARIIEGEALPDPAAFSRRLNDVMSLGLAQ